jgi:hypothetical protein
MTRQRNRRPGSLASIRVVDDALCDCTIIERHETDVRPMTNTFTYTYQSGDSVETAEVRFPPTSRPDFPSCAIFACAKSGSVLVNAVTHELMADAGIPTIDLPSMLYEQGVDIGNIQGDLSHALPRSGYCFAGFRAMPPSFVGAPAVQSLRKLLVVRDPRDMLVSRYFSAKFSHGFVARGTPQFSQIVRQMIGDTGLDIDSYCLFYSWLINADLFMYEDIVSDPKTYILRYEDFIYDKERLVSSLANWFGLDVPQERRSSMAALYHVIPPTERSHDHTRQVHPGDHKRKLQPKTVYMLNGVLGQFMARFGYQPN